LGDGGCIPRLAGRGGAIADRKAPVGFLTHASLIGRRRTSVAGEVGQGAGFAIPLFIVSFYLRRLYERLMRGMQQACRTGSRTVTLRCMHCLGEIESSQWSSSSPFSKQHSPDQQTCGGRPKPSALTYCTRQQAVKILRSHQSCCSKQRQGSKRHHFLGLVRAVRSRDIDEIEDSEAVEAAGFVLRKAGFQWAILQNSSRRGVSRRCFG